MKIRRLMIYTFLLLSSAGILFAAEHRITFIHWNDLHSQNVPWKPTHYNPDGHTAGGYAFLASVIDSLKSVYPEAMTVHAGDDFQGTPISSITRGMSQIAILNIIQPDIFTVGNHEFDYGVSRLLALKDSAGFDMYAANIYREEGGSRLFESFMIPDHFPFKAALIGLTTGNLYSLCVPSNLEGIYVEDPVVTARHLVDSLTAEGYEFIVAATHQGIEDDMDLAEKVPGIDLIIGGHSHTYMSKPRKVGQTYIVQASSRGRYVGELHITTDGREIQDADFNVLEVRPDKIKAHPEVAGLVDYYESMAGNTLDEVIGELKTDWVRGGRESNIGNWLTDAMRKYTGADIAIQNNGGIRKNLSAGPITVRDIWEISPFGNHIITFTVSAKELREMLAHQIENGFSLQFSGVTFDADTSANQPKSLRVNGKRVWPWKTYTVATNNYVGEQLEKYLDLPPKDVKDLGIKDRDLFIRAVEDEKDIHSVIEGRIRIR